MTNKVLKSFLSVVLAVVVIFALKSYSFAGNITSAEVNEAVGKINVEGKAGTGVLAVAITVFDESETNVVAMKTTSVDDSSNFSDSISVAAGKYVVKVADYNGGEFVTKTVTVTVGSDTTDETKADESNENKSNAIKINSSNPKTGDIIIRYVILLAISSIILFFTFRKRKVNKNK